MVPIVPTVAATQGETLLQHPVIEIRPTIKALHNIYGLYFSVGSDFSAKSGPMKITATQDAADDITVFITLREARFFYL